MVFPQKTGAPVTVRLRFLSAAVFLFAFALYLHGLSPGLSVGDSGEFIAASGTLGLAHPPAYPLFSLMGRAVSSAVPWGALPYRINLLSALCGAWAVGLTVWTAFRIFQDKTAAAIAGLCLAFAPVFWLHAQDAEVFTLLLFWTSLLFAAAVSDMPIDRKVFFLCFAFGLGLGNHHTLLLAAPGLAVLLWPERKRLSLGLAAQAVGWFALGFSVYLYLPLRSAHVPALDWGHPVDWDRFWRVVLRKDYGSLALTTGEPYPRTIFSAWEQLARFGKGMAQEFTWGGLLAACAGFALWWKQDRRSAAGFLVLTLTAGPGFLLLGNMPFDAQSNGVLDRFFIMPLWPFCLSLGALAAFWKHRRPSARLLFVPIFVLGLIQGMRFSHRNNFVAHDYGKNLLRTMPPNTVLFMDGGDDTFYTLAALHLAQGSRPDLELHDRGGLIYKNIYGSDFRRLDKKSKEARRQEIERSFLGNRPVYYSTFNKAVLPSVTQIQRGILYEVVPERRETSDKRLSLWSFYSFRSLYGPWNREYRTRALSTVYDVMAGLDDWNAGEKKRARAHFARAESMGSDVLWLSANLNLEYLRWGWESVQKGDWNEAERMFQRALVLNPKDALAYTNLGVVAENKGDLALAKSYHERAIAVQPDYAEAYYNLGTLYWREKNWPKVVECYEQVLMRNPNHERARAFLEKARALAGRS